MTTKQNKKKKKHLMELSFNKNPVDGLFDLDGGNAAFVGILEMCRK